TQARGGGDRQAAEAEVAEAVEEAGRPQPDAVVPQAANTEVAPAQKDNVKGASPDPAPPAEDLTPDPASPPVEPGEEAAAKPAAKRRKKKPPTVAATDAPAEPAAAEPVAEVPAADVAAAPEPAPAPETEGSAT
ncbi:MAG TPA: hypothetical protein VGR11_09735, partial [Solirubrobacteraceae bacterium]|nr:hypothetical protein [Solirubrobacteraceae bacterium]